MFSGVFCWMINPIIFHLIFFAIFVYWESLMCGALTEWSIVQVCKTSVRGFESHGHLIKKLCWAESNSQFCTN